MEHLCDCVTMKMINLDIINCDDRDYYCYSIQLLFERTICISLILLLAGILHSLIEILSFLTVFILIRRYSDGFHCRTSLGCILASSIMTLSTIPLVRYLFADCAVCIGGGHTGYDHFVHNSYCRQPQYGINRNRAEPP